MITFVSIDWQLFFFYAFLEQIIVEEMKSRMRKNRRISLNAFKPQCDLRPYLEVQQAGLSAFETSLMLMQVLKKHENLMFGNKKEELQTTMNHLQSQNALLNRIKEIRTKKKQKVLLSSFKVLEELDINRKYAYQTLEQENKQIADRIYGLETALERINCTKKRQTLCMEYLQKLEKKVKKRKGTQEKLDRIIEGMEEDIENEMEIFKKQIQELLQTKIGKGKSKENERIREIIQAIFTKFEQ